MEIGLLVFMVGTVCQHDMSEGSPGHLVMVTCSGCGGMPENFLSAGRVGGGGGGGGGVAKQKTPATSRWTLYDSLFYHCLQPSLFREYQFLV